MKIKHPIFFWDLDGCLAQFAAGSLAVHGLQLSAQDTKWDFMTQLGFSGGMDPRFWAPLENEKFWAELPVHHDGMKLFRLVEALVGPERVGILSSGLCPKSPEGKRLWLEKHIPGYEKRTIFGTSKGMIAGPGKVLLDDYDGNIDSFVANGGQAITIPRPWNRRKSETCELGNFDVDTIFEEIQRLLI